MKLNGYKKKIKIKKFDTIQSLIKKKLDIKKIKLLATKPLEATKNSVDKFYKDYKKHKEKEEIKREKKIRLENKKKA